MHFDFAVLFEAVLESAPQFIIQLFAISVQEEHANNFSTYLFPQSGMGLYNRW